VATGLRRGEVQGLRWRQVYLADPMARTCVSRRRGVR
jgi:integrase